MSGLRKRWQHSLLGIRIDAQQDTFLAQSHQRCHGLAPQLDAVCLGHVGHSIGFQGDTLYLPTYALGGGYLVQMKVSLSILIEVSWLRHRLVCLDGDAESSAWKEIGDSLQSTAWHKGGHLCLCLACYGHCHKQG